ncbi:hypothetical protein CAPTEDRAFT_214376 [Capitella teleta]|uniref:Alkaline ceramidase n=1 Tax=Capitella teleta TaxID=283909 RepID=R7TMJ5_CAPTE|nr:hypothetical protein CAPTEDRAFT_214376 [Capitella teleta]|eukprot:ELT92776.1 hypothetical protein CAPTEDRAFT_214376 [Capitella teleta]
MTGNTISNISMIAPPLLGAVLAYIDGMEVRFIGCHLALMVVGIGSSFFHATLLYEMQLMDELPMIWGSAFLIYSLASMDNAPGKINAPLGIGLFLYSLIVTLVYIMVKDPIFHEAAYGLMVVTMIALSVRIMRNHDSSWWCFMAALSLYTIGFIIWNLDNHFCHHFRSARESMGYPLKPLMQGHAWWHLFAGAGTYLSIVFSTHARLKFLKKEPVWKASVACKMICPERVHM